MFEKLKVELGEAKGKFDVNRKDLKSLYDRGSVQVCIHIIQPFHTFKL